MVSLVCDYADSPLHISICNRYSTLPATIPSLLLPYKQKAGFIQAAACPVKGYISRSSLAARCEHVTELWPVTSEWKGIAGIPGRPLQGARLAPPGPSSLPLPSAPGGAVMAGGPGAFLDHVVTLRMEAACSRAEGWKEPGSLIKNLSSHPALCCRLPEDFYAGKEALVCLSPCHFGISVTHSNT